MRICRRNYLAVLVLAAAASFAPALLAQSISSDPVGDLRDILKAPALNLLQRDQALRDQIRSIEGVSELRNALTLREWRDEDPSEQLAAVDQRNRAVLARRFESAVRELVHKGDAASRVAIVNMIGKMGTEVRGVAIRNSLASVFATDLADLIKRSDSTTREAAARALGQINPDPEVAIPVLGQLLATKAPSQRVAAGEGLVNLMKVISQLATQNQAPGSVEASRADAVKVGCAVVPLAGRWLNDEQVEVRRKCVAAIGQAGEALQKMVNHPRNPAEMEDRADYQRQVEREEMELLPLIRVLRNQGLALTRALGDKDAETRLLAQRALVDMTSPQIRLLERASSLTREARKTVQIIRPASHQNLLLEGLNETVQSLASGLHGSDVDARRAAMEVLETLGPAAAPAAADLVTALSDKDLFVRWAAARTLGKITPLEAERAVPALALLLADNDPDLRLAALNSLERYGPAARSAIPELTRALRYTDAELRVGAIRALGAVGCPEVKPALPALIEAVADVDARVRQTAAEVLGRFGAAACEAEEALTRAMQDGDSEVQKAAGEALLRIKRPVKK